MQIKNSQFSSIEQIAGQYLQNAGKSSRSDQNAEAKSFQEVLTSKVESKSKELKFTKHASERLGSRDINISDEQMERLENGAKRAGEKGIKESLVLVDSLAFIVNTRQNTVITAMNQAETSENIYTNIDGAVIM
ncbi:MAG: flagellar protein [Lachnospiraceae bacterium]|nr:flagellar protein [Lachnospiraceae bacterium]